MTDQRRPASRHGISGGGTMHLVDIYAQNAVREIIENARTVLSSERGRFILPSEFMDRLVVECGELVLANGPVEAERAVCGRIIEFLDRRNRLRHEDDERKVRRSLTRDRSP